MDTCFSVLWLKGSKVSKNTGYPAGLNMLKWTLLYFRLLINNGCDSKAAAGGCSSTSHPSGEISPADNMVSGRSSIPA